MIHPPVDAAPMPGTLAATPLPQRQVTRRWGRARLVGAAPVLAALTLLALAVATDRLGVRVSGYLNLRLELILGGVVALWSVWRARGRVRAGVGPVEAALFGWWIVGAGASLVVSPNVGESLKFSVMMAGLLTLYGAGRLLIRTPHLLTGAALAWVAVGTAVTGFGLLAAALYTIMGWIPGISFNRLYQNGVFSAVPMVYSTMWEANLFGSYALTVGVLAFALGRAPAFAQGGRQWALRGAVACAFGGLVVSMTRTAWAAALLLLVFVGALCLARRIATPRAVLTGLLLPVLVGGGSGLLLGQAMPTVHWRTDTPWVYSYEQVEQIASQMVRGGPPPPAPVATPPPPAAPPPVADPPAAPAPTSAFLDRLLELLALNKVPTYVLREQVATNAIAGWQQQPLFGWGFNTYRYVFPPGPRNGFWIGNLELHLLFDTGAVGLILFAGALGIAAWRGVRALRPPPATWATAHYVLLGLLLAGLGLLGTYQLTEGTGLGFTWLLLAMLVAAGEIAGKSAARPTPLP